MRRDCGAQWHPLALTRILCYGVQSVTQAASGARTGPAAAASTNLKQRDIRSLLSQLVSQETVESLAIAVCCPLASRRVVVLVSCLPLPCSVAPCVSMSLAFSFSMPLRWLLLCRPFAACVSVWEKGYSVADQRQREVWKRPARRANAGR